jgi:hypothetical protein
MRLLDEGLARLDATWPPHSDVPALLVGHARQVLQGQWPLPGRMIALRRGFFSPVEAELAACDALITRLTCMSAPLVGLVARQQQWSQWATEGSDWSWTIVGSRIDHWRRLEKSHLIGIAELRLLRLALAFELGEPLPELVDPLTGGPFEVRIDGNVASFRSSANVDVVRWAERRH